MPKPNKKNVIKTSLILDKDFSTLQFELVTCSQISIERMEEGALVTQGLLEARKEGLVIMFLISKKKVEQAH